MSIPARLKTLLDDQHVRYEVMTHPYAPTSQRAAQVEHVPGKKHAKVVMVEADGQMIMVVCPASDRIDLPKLERSVGKPTRLATEEEFRSLFPDCETGAMPPFGELYGVPVYVDQSMKQAREFVFEAGTHTDAIRMKFDDFERIAHPHIEDVTQHS